AQVMQSIATTVQLGSNLYLQRAADMAVGLNPEECPRMAGMADAVIVKNGAQWQVTFQNLRARRRLEETQIDRDRAEFYWTLITVQHQDHLTSQCLFRNFPAQ